MLLESSLLQWVVLLKEFSVDTDKRMNHDLTYELLDVFYSKQSLMPDLPPQLVGTGRCYEHVRSKPSEFRLVEWPLQTLRRMRVLIEPVTVLVANFIHASAVRNFCLVFSRRYFR